MGAIDDVIAAVQARGEQPVDVRELESVATTLRELGRLGDAACDEHADPVHVTGSALIFGERGVVLLKHKRLGIWVQPGGHVDPGETPAQAALREGIEETGMHLELASEHCIHVDVHPGPRGHTHLDLRYECVAPGEPDPSPGEDESQDVAWFDWDTAIGMADDGIRGLLLSRRLSAT